MTDDMTDCARRDRATRPAGQSAQGRAGSVVNQLPTLQRNALRKIFDRPEFTPEEVAALGFRRVQQAEGIGNKGLAAITAWLRRYGYDLKAPDPHEAAPTIRSRNRRNIEMAVRLLRTHGYVVLGSGDTPEDGGALSS